MQLSKSNRVAFLPNLRAIRLRISKEQVIAVLITVLAIIAIRLPIDYKRIMTITDNDITIHIYYALDMLHHRPVPLFIWAHPLWEITLIGIWWLSRSHIDFWQSAIGLQVMSSVAAGLLIYFWYGALPTKPAPWKRAFWAITLIMVTPVSLPTLIDGSYYFGYIGLADYHNPTTHILLPFAILLFILAIGALQTKTQSWWEILIAFGAVIAATLFKPNLTFALLPAAGLVFCYRWIRKQPVGWKMMIFGFGVPALAVLSAQYLILFVNGNPSAKIAFMPLAVARVLSSYIALKFFLSILFPLVITVVFFAKARRDLEMILAWLVFAVAAAQYYLLAELPLLNHANFVWGAQIALFLLFVVCGRFILKQDFSLKAIANRKAWISYLAYLPHILAGIAYYIFCYITPHYG